MIEPLLSFLLGHRVRELPDVPVEAIPSDVVLRHGRFVPWLGGVLSRMKQPAAAVTIGRTIVLYPEARLTADLLTHELVHVRQWQQDPLFPIRYSLATLRYGYRNNPYEVEARSLATSEWPSRASSERT